MKATNIVPVRNADQPFISFQADPRVAAIFRDLGQLFSDSQAGRNMWVLYPHTGQFDNALLTIMTYETED